MQLPAALLEAYTLQLADRLQNPNHRSDDGWRALVAEGANWYECANITLEVLKRYGVQPKATFLCFQIAEEICTAHGWYDINPTKDKPTLVAKSYPIQWVKFRIGGYCLKTLILTCKYRLEHTHEPGNDRVVLLMADEAIKTYVNDYTQFHPLMLWTAPTDDKERHLIKYSNGTSWTPDDWHFNGRPRIGNEERLTHPLFIEEWKIGTAPPFLGKNIIKSPKANLLPSIWVRAANKFESNEYRINAEVLQLMKDLDDQLEDHLVEKTKVKHPTGKKSKRIKFQRQEFEDLLKTADALREFPGTFYQRIHLDHRGRMYLSRNPLHYQGDDKMRCLIEFADGVEVDATGFEMMLLHTANLYEVTGTEQHRIDEAKKNLKRWVGYARNPTKTYSKWNHLDDPFCFIRACMELRDSTTDKTLKLRKGFNSHLPVEFDQSNSVIAHLAMISGQRNVADMANMLRYTDFYREIAEEWDIDGSNFKMDIKHRRKIVKKIVVPRCYGAGAAEVSYQIRKLEKNIPFIKKCSDQRLIEIADAGIHHLEEKVPALKEFRRSVGRRISALDLQNNPDAEVAWSTASEFECHVRPVAADRDEIQLPNQCYDIEDDKFAVVKLIARYPKNSISPKMTATGMAANVVHSIDAALAHRVITYCDFPVIALHDAFAVHASNAMTLRQTFVNEMSIMHHVFQPYALWEHDVAGVPLPEGILTEGHELQRQIIELADEIENYLGSIS